MKKFLLQKSVRFAVLFGAAALFSAMFTLVQLKPQASDSPVAGMRAGGAFALMDHTGKAVTDQNYAGFYKIVFFGFTYCPEICPTTLQNIANALAQLQEAERARLKTLFVTVDPARDTPQVMAEYVARFHPEIIGLTGTPEQTAAAQKAYKVYAAKAEGGTDGAYNMNHSGFIYIMSPDGTLLEILRASDDVQAIVQAIRNAQKSV